MRSNPKTFKVQRISSQCGDPRFEQLLKLRHYIIREMLKWLPESEDKSDRDWVDSHPSTIHLIAARRSDEFVQSYMRILPGTVLTDFMAGNDFREFTTPQREEFDNFLRAHQGQMVEISRLISAQSSDSREATQAMLKYAASLLQRSGRRYCIVVLAKPVYKYLRSIGVHFLERPVSKDTECIACIIDVLATGSNWAT